MPIRFRCPHCEQLLGISRSKAGAILDCPTCGRSVRVPERDGLAETVSDRTGLDLDDDCLRRALGDLAEAGSVTRQGDEPMLAAGPLSAAIDVAPAPPPPVIDVGPPAHRAHPSAPLMAPTPPLAAPPAANGPPSSSPLEPPAALPAVSGLQAELAQLAQAGAFPTMRAPRRRTPMRGGLVSALVGLGALAAVAAGFGAGYVAAARIASASPAENTASDPRPEANASARPQGNAPVPPEPAVKGRITYEASGGRRLPDRGAVVLLFPVARKGTVKFSAVGFRPSDAPDDMAIAREALRMAGGDLAVVDEEGNFRSAPLPAGTYRLLLLSSYQSRPSDAAPEAAATQFLAGFFDRPDQLLGRLAFEFDEVELSGTTSELRDHLFRRAL